MKTGYDLTPTQRLILLALCIEPNQTIKRLQANTGTKTERHLASALRALCIISAVEGTPGEDGSKRFSLRTKICNPKS